MKIEELHQSDTLIVVCRDCGKTNDDDVGRCEKDGLLAKMRKFASKVR